MNTLATELRRLYLPRPAADAAAPPDGLLAADGTVRALVMELRRPPEWEVLARVWQGVQAELDLPAPAIAVSGNDAMQLWFALAEPVAAVQAHAFLDVLRRRFLPDVDARRLRLLPTPALEHAALVPAEQAGSGNWSAFVAPDLAPVFGDTPWLDIPPNEEGQASLLRGLALVKPAAFDAALRQLGTQAPAAAPAPAPLPQPAARTEVAGDAIGFLRRVMDDEGVPMALRIEAAKALLQSNG
nr:hypothetical protein [Variovorax boronicumulans]